MHSSASEQSSPMTGGVSDGPHRLPSPTDLANRSAQTPDSVHFCAGGQPVCVKGSQARGARSGAPASGVAPVVPPLVVPLPLVPLPLVPPLVVARPVVPPVAQDGQVMSVDELAQAARSNNRRTRLYTAA